MEHRANIRPHRLHQGDELGLGIADQNIIIGVQHEKGDQLLCTEGFAGAGNAQQKGRLVQQIGLVHHDEIMADGVFSKVDTALVHDLLYLEGDEHGQALGGQCAEGVDATGADGQNGVEAVKLLELQNSQLAHVLSRHRQHSVRVLVELLFAVGG